MKSGQVDIEYLNFADWKAQANASPRHILKPCTISTTARRKCSISATAKWYLIYQMADKTQTPPFGPCYSASTTWPIPTHGSKPRYLLDQWPGQAEWLDFWVIADETRPTCSTRRSTAAFWHVANRMADFPVGWSEPELAIQADIFEASHTYRLKGATST